MIGLISVIAWMLASICNALMDTLQFHWYKFRWKDSVNAQFWNPQISWKQKYIDGDPKKGRKQWCFGKLCIDKPVVFTDAWHFIKMLMIVFITISTATFPLLAKGRIFENVFWNTLSSIVLFGLIWNLIFSIFYDKVFVKEEK